MRKSLFFVGVLGLFLFSCSDNSGGNKSIFSTKEAETGVYSTHPEALHSEDEGKEEAPEHAKDSAKTEIKPTEANEKTAEAKDTVKIKTEKK